MPAYNRESFEEVRRGERARLRELEAIGLEFGRDADWIRGEWESGTDPAEARDRLAARASGLGPARARQRDPSASGRRSAPWSHTPRMSSRAFRRRFRSATAGSKRWTPKPGQRLK